MMTISLFTSTLGKGGAEHSTMRLASGFASRGIKVDLVCQRAEGPLESRVPDDVRVVDLGAYGSSPYLRAVSSVVPLVSYLQRSRPSVLIASHPRITNVIALLSYRIAGVETAPIIVERNSLSSYFSDGSVVKRIRLGLLRQFYPHSRIIVAVSQGVREDLIRLIPSLSSENVQVVYNPAYTPDLEALSREPLDHPWFGPTEPPIVLGAGRLTNQKDFSTLIRAFHRLSKTHDARLVILGEGKNRAELEDLVSALRLNDRVHLAGFVDNPYKYMKSADVFVLSSRFEGFGNVLVEAMACGCNVVSTNCRSGPAEILEDGRWGHLVPVGEPKPMARAISRCLNKHDFTAKQRAKDFTLKRIVDEYIGLIERLK